MFSAKLTILPQNFPFPFRAAIAFSNDCEFLTFEAYQFLQRRISSERYLSIPISNSVFFYTTHSSCHSSISYFEGISFKESKYAGYLRELIQDGSIDTIHAYGDFDRGGFNRSMAEKVAEELQKHNLKIRIFTNHGSNQNFQNLGHQDLSHYQKGDDSHSEYYHADLMDHMGVQYIWVDEAADLEFTPRKDLIYQKFGRDGILRNYFWRYRGLPGKPAPNLSSFTTQLNSRIIENILKSESAAIFYQHFGVAKKIADGVFEEAKLPLFTEEQFEIFDQLYRLRHQGLLWLPSSSRLLDFEMIRKGSLAYLIGNCLEIHTKRNPIGTGLSFLSPKKPQEIKLFLEHQEVKKVNIDIIESYEGFYITLGSELGFK